MGTILWRPYYGDLISIIETTLWRPNFGDLILCVCFTGVLQVKTCFAEICGIIGYKVKLIC